MVDIAVWRARIGLFNLRIRRSEDERVKILIELRARLLRRAKRLRDANIEEAQLVMEQEREEGGDEKRKRGGAEDEGKSGGRREGCNSLIVWIRNIDIIAQHTELLVLYIERNS